MGKRHFVTSQKRVVSILPQPVCRCFPDATPHRGVCLKCGRQLPERKA